MNLAASGSIDIFMVIFREIDWMFIIWFESVEIARNYSIMNS